MSNPKYRGDRYSLIPTRYLPHMFFLWALATAIPLCIRPFLPIDPIDHTISFNHVLFLGASLLFAGVLSILMIGLTLMSWPQLSNLRKLAGTIPLLVVVLLVVLTRQGIGRPLPSQTATPDELSKLAGMNVPPSAYGIKFVTKSGVDQVVYGRFKLDATNVDGFLAGLPEEANTVEFDGHSQVTMHEVNQEWWRPSVLESPKKVEWSSASYSGKLAHRHRAECGGRNHLLLQFHALNSRPLCADLPLLPPRVVC